MTEPEPGVDPPAVGRVAERLAGRYGEPVKPRLDPLDELVLTILSQNTTDRNRDRAWEALRERYDGWSEVRDTPREALEETIRVAGLAARKAAAIQGALERLTEELGEPTLDHLERMDDEDALDYLSGFAGVGVKTAACVLCFALGRPVLPVDTHVHRVARRLGWVARRESASAAHRTLNRDVPPELRFPLHLHLIRLGRDACAARRPRCAECPLEDLCPRTGVET